MKQLLILAALFSSSAFSAPLDDYVRRQDVKMFIECGLRDTEEVSCEEIVRGFFSDFGTFFQRTNSATGADIHVTLTDQEVPGQASLYTFSWAASTRFSVSEFFYTVPIDHRQLDSVAMLNQILLNMKKGAAVYLKVMSAKIDGEGNAVIAYGHHGTPTQRNSKFNQGPFYIDVLLNWNGSKNSINSSRNELTNVNGNYSGEKVRVQLFQAFGRNSQKLPDGSGQIIEANNRWRSTSGIVSYTLSKEQAKKDEKKKPEWSVAVIASTYTQPLGNVERSTDIEGGIELNFVPFRTTENHELYFRVGLGNSDYRLGLENELGKVTDSLLHAFAQIYVYWVFLDNKLNLNLQGKLSTYPKYAGYQQYNASSNLNYQITPSIRVSGSYSYTYQKKSMTYPKNPDFSNPLNTMYLSNAPGASSQFSVGIGVTLGNSLKRSRDRRWSGF